MSYMEGVVVEVWDRRDGGCAVDRDIYSRAGTLKS